MVYRARHSSLKCIVCKHDNVIKYTLLVDKKDNKTPLCKLHGGVEVR